METLKNDSKKVFLANVNDHSRTLEYWMNRKENFSNVIKQGFKKFNGSLELNNETFMRLSKYQKYIENMKNFSDLLKLVETQSKMEFYCELKNIYLNPNINVGKVIQCSDGYLSVKQQKDNDTKMIINVPKNTPAFCISVANGYGFNTKDDVVFEAHRLQLVDRNFNGEYIFDLL